MPQCIECSEAVKYNLKRPQKIGNLTPYNTLSMTGFSSSLSIGIAVEWTQVLVHKCLNRT